MCAISIGGLSRRTGTPVATIRYYEQIGLLAEAGRTRGGQRVFGPDTEPLLGYIRARRALGYSLAEIADLIRISGPGTAACKDARAAAAEQLAKVRVRMADLRAVEETLIRQIAICDDDCAAAPEARCILLPGPGTPAPTAARRPRFTPAVP
jgi:DNA-binding transcriptional MerR regulator